MSTLTFPEVVDVINEEVSSTEKQVQELLLQLENAPQDVQALFLMRVLSALATKIPAALPAKIYSEAKSVASTKPTNPKNKIQKDEDPPPTLDPQLPQLRNPGDPIEAWERFGAEWMRSRLVFEQDGYLSKMLENLPKIKGLGKAPGKTSTRTKKAQYIVACLEKHYT